MGKPKTGAILMAKQKKEADKHKLKLPKKGERLVNQNEIRSFGVHGLGEDQIGHFAFRNDTEEDQAVTITGNAYNEFVQNKRFLLTMQEDLIAEDDIDDKLEEQADYITTPQQIAMHESQDSYKDNESDY